MMLTHLKKIEYYRKCSEITLTPYYPSSVSPDVKKNNVLRYLIVFQVKGVMILVFMSGLGA